VNFDLSEDQRTIKSTARELLAARYPLAEVRRLALEDERGFTDAQWAEMVELGWPEIAELGIVELAVVAEELGYALAPTPLASTWAAGLLLAAGGRADVLADGRRGTVAMWDDDRGLDPTASSLRPEGPRLTGVKVAVPDAGAADVLVVTAAEGRHFLVEAGAPGVAVEPARGIDATRRPFTVGLSGVEAEELGGGGGFDRAWHAIAVMTAAESVGVGQRTMEMAVEYARERKQFGRAIGSYQAVSHACAQMLLEVEGARSAVYWAAWALDAEPETAPLATACAKAYASDAGARVARSALQVHGGIGFTWEHDLHFFLKRAEVNARAYGDARWQRDRVAELAGL
jgi:alkylation response protein AidB-like acyl-CoA dehydrogenase